MLLERPCCVSGLIFLTEPKILLSAGGNIGKQATMMPSNGSKVVTMPIRAIPLVKSLILK